MKIESAQVLVTGGSSGIGFATAKLLVEKGARVAICGRDRAKLERAAAEIGALAIRADVSKEADVREMVPTVIETFGDYNVLINNAAFGNWNNLLDLQLDEMERLFATNVFGAMLVARESARHFVAKTVRQHRQRRLIRGRARLRGRLRVRRQQIRAARDDRMLAG